MIDDELQALIDVFPTAVGMNRIVSVGIDVPNSVPHSRGDEPFDSRCVS